MKEIMMIKNTLFPFLIFMGLFLMCLSIGTKAQTILVNEVMSSNGNTQADKDGDYSDWIELYNSSDQNVNLEGFGLSDAKNDPKKWIFPPVEIKAKSFLLIWTSGKGTNENGELHTNFSISASGEEVLVSDQEGNILDFISPIEIPRDYSYGRLQDGENEFAFFSEPTPGTSNSLGKVIAGFAPEIEPSVQPGFYGTNQSVDFIADDPETTIYYTTDGSTPTTNSQQLNGSIPISNRTQEANYFSMIPTTNHGGARGYQTPKGKVAKGTIIRTLAVKDGHEPTLQSFTYFIFPNASNEYSLPVFSIVTDEKNLFSDEIGLFVPGNTYDSNHPKPYYTGNYFQRGEEWERPVHISLFDKNGNLGFEENAGLRIHGGITRQFPQKALRIYFRSEYGNNSLDYKLFSDRDYTNPRRFLLRASGNDFGETYFRDAFAHQLISHLDIDYQSYEPSIVFINGEYWGMHNIRERQDKHYLNNLYNVDPENIDLLTGLYGVQEGDYLQYKFVLDLLSDLDKEDEESIKELEKYIDLSNHIDYMIAQIYVANTDWPHNNIDFWREKVEYSPDAAKGRDGRFRWLFYDTDYGLSHVNKADHNTLNWVTQEKGFEGQEWPNFVFRNLLGHKLYKELFINRFLDNLNTSFHPERANALLQQMKQSLEPEIEEHLNRWIEPGSKAKWEEKINEMRGFVNDRHENVLNHLKTYFQISNSYKVTLNTSIPYSGYIKINSTEIKPSTPGVGVVPFPWEGTYFEEIPIQVSPIPEDGYLFDHWLINGEKEFEEEVDIKLEKDTEITAVFSIDPVVRRKAIYYWFFGSNIENDIALEEIEPFYSKNKYNNTLTFFPAVSPYPSNGTAGIMDRVNDPTEINFISDLLEETGQSYSDMKGIRVRNPLQIEDKMAYLVLDAPMNTYEKPKISTAVSRTSNGPESIILSYRLSVDDNWTSDGLSQSLFTLSTAYELIELDFGDIEGITNNPEFQIRIDFEGNTTPDTGNIRFNNISIEAYPLTGDDLVTGNPLLPKENQASLIKKAYPNPVMNLLHLELEEHAVHEVNTIQLLDARGVEIKRIDHIPDGLIKLGMEQFSNGFYIINVFSNYQFESIKILKQ